MLSYPYQGYAPFQVKDLPYIINALEPQYIVYFCITLYIIIIQDYIQYLQTYQTVFCLHMSANIQF